MRTSMTSWHSSDVLGAFIDELEKIGSAEQERKEKIKRWVRNSAIIAAGTGAGTGASMLTEHAARHLLGAKWATMSPSSRQLVLAPAIGLTSIGAAMAARRLMEERAKND